MQKLLVEYPRTEDNDDGNGSESSATSLIYEEDVCHPRTDQSLIIPEVSPLKQNVGIQCCIAAKTFDNFETQTHDIYLSQSDNIRIIQIIIRFNSSLEFGGDDELSWCSFCSCNIRSYDSLTL